LRLWKFHSFFLGLAAIFCALELVEKKRIKEFLKKVKKILDKILFCNIVTDIEKCAPTQSGRFAFQGGSLPPFCTREQSASFRSSLLCA